jgi:hypothetical protein
MNRENNDYYDGIDEDILQCRLDIERAKSQEHASGEKDSDDSNDKGPRIPSFEEVISAHAQSQNLEDENIEQKNKTSSSEQYTEKTADISNDSKEKGHEDEQSLNKEDQSLNDDNIVKADETAKTELIEDNKSVEKEATENESSLEIEPAEDESSVDDEPEKDEIPTFNLAEQIMSAQRSRVSASRTPPRSKPDMKDKSNQLQDVVNSIKGGDVLEISSSEELDNEPPDGDKNQDTQQQVSKDADAEETTIDEAETGRDIDQQGDQNSDLALESLLNKKAELKNEETNDKAKEHAKPDILPTVPSRRVHVNLPSRLSHNQKLILENIVTRDINRIMRERKDANSVSYSSESLN